MSTRVDSSSSYLLTFASLAMASALAISCQPAQAPVELEAEVQVASPVSVERGEYLVRITGCHDCHTPFQMGPDGPEPDMSRMLSGHPEDLVMPPPPELPEGPWVWLASGTNTAFSGPWGPATPSI